jgi:MFS family permease
MVSAQNATAEFFKFLAQMYMNYLVLIIAPLMGLIVQPIIGHYSDKRGKFGRRKLSFSRCLLASIGLILMPQAEIFIAFSCLMGWCRNADDYGCVFSISPWNL